MKIYTEVNYEWKDGSLVQTSSKSFDYTGDITLCGVGGGGLSKLKKKVTSTTTAAKEKVMSTTSDLKESIDKTGVTKQKLKVGGDLGKALDQGKKNVHSASTTARSNAHGVTTAAKTGIHTGADQAKTLAHKGADALKTGWDNLRGKPKEETGGGGTGASSSAMGSESGVKEASKVGESGKQFDTGKKKRLNTKKDKLKVRKTGPQ